MSEGAIEYKSQENIAVITIDRPEKRNAMTAKMCDELRAAFERLRDSEDRVAILAAAGNTFCAGADLTAPPGNFWQAIPDVGIEIGKPVILCVQGPVVGMAVTLGIFCDLCVASEDAKFLYPEARIGVSKGLISSIVSRLPHKMAMELMLTGGPITAARAYEVGFVNRLAPAGEQLAVAMDMAREIARSAPLVIAQLKQLSSDTLPRSPAETMYRAMGLVDKVMDSADAQEGVNAFKEKRAPIFQGK